jgi:hypothetical protein
VNEFELIADARRTAILRLRAMVQESDNDYALSAAEFLLSPELHQYSFAAEDPAIIVDAGDAPYVPCDCPVCDPDVDDRDEYPDDPLDFSPFIRYEVFFQ